MSFFEQCQWDAGGMLAHDTGLLKKDLTLVLEKSLTLNVMSEMEYTLKSAS